MKFVDILNSILSNDKIIGAISSATLIILLGLYLRKKEILEKSTAKILSDVILSASLPALAFNAFMQDINKTTLVQGINLLIWGFVMYISFIFISKIFFLKYKGDKQIILQILSVFGSTTFFGIPVVGAVYGATGVMYASIFNIAYRVFLYSYVYIKISGIKMEKKNIKDMFLNPIVLATFIGMFIWIFQSNLPQVAIVAKDSTKNYAFLRIDKTLPWLFQVLDYLAKLCSPLAWLSIGAKLADISFKDAISDLTSWYYTLVKVIFIPLLNILILYILNVTNILPISFTGVAAVVILMSTPPATVAVAYSIKFDKEAILSSNTSLLSTVICVIFMPIWIVILEVIKTLNLFSM